MDIAISQWGNTLGLACGVGSHEAGALPCTTECPHLVQVHTETHSSDLWRVVTHMRLARIHRQRRVLTWYKLRKLLQMKPGVLRVVAIHPKHPRLTGPDQLVWVIDAQGLV
jgi:hypothetical protein